MVVIRFVDIEGIFYNCCLSSVHNTVPLKDKVFIHSVSWYVYNTLCQFLDFQSNRPQLNRPQNESQIGPKNKNKKE
jgi:hypothetical protein